MAERSDPDPTVLPKFLAHLEPRDARAAGLARRLLDSGWDVESLSGPVQMDVWELTVRRDAVAVRFGVERGMSDGVLIGPAESAYDDLVPLSFAVLGWARASGAELPLDDPDEFRPDYGAYGAQAAEWVRTGGRDAFARIAAARRQYLLRRHSLDQRLGDVWLAQTKAWGAEMLEAAAAPRDPAGADGRRNDSAQLHGR